MTNDGRQRRIIGAPDVSELSERNAALLVASLEARGVLRADAVAAARRMYMVISAGLPQPKSDRLVLAITLGALARSKRPGRPGSGGDDGEAHSRRRR